jgi:hypothetical protein
MTGRPAERGDGGQAATTSPSQDVATLLSLLPTSGGADDVTLLMDVYEAAERSYRAGVQASTPHIGSSSTTNG